MNLKKFLMVFVSVLILQLGLVFKSYDVFSLNFGIRVLNKTCNNEKIEDAINNASLKYGVDKNLIKSLIKQESNFDPLCFSSAGAIGLMQIMPNTVKKFNVENPYDIYQNIDAGTRHLKGMIERYEGDIVKAVAAYNCGGNALDKSGFKSLDDVSMLPKETQIHIVNIFNYYKNEIKIK